MERQPMDIATYSEQAQNGPCFICRLVAGDPAHNPLLPVDLIATLLNHPDTAEGAAANSNLPTARLHELLDYIELPRAATA